MTAEMLSMLLVFLGLMALLGTIAKFGLALINRRRTIASGSAVSLDEIARQIADLQQAVDATAIEVERISEAQRFTSKLLAGRTDPTRALLEASDNPAAR